MKVPSSARATWVEGIGTRAVAGGHEVEIVDRDPAEAEKLAQELGSSASALEPDAPFGGEVAVFAVYYPGIKDAVVEHADRLAGAVVVDIGRRRGPPPAAGSAARLSARCSRRRRTAPGR